MQLYFAVGEDDERRRSDRGLGHVENPDLLPRGYRGALEIDVLEEAVHFAGADALAALAGDFFQRREYFFGAFPGGGGDEQYGRITEKFKRAPQPLFIGFAVGGPLVFLHARGFRLPARPLFAAEHQVPFVHDDDHRPAALVGVSRDGGIELTYTFRRIDHQQGNVGGFQVLARHDDGELFRHQVRLALSANAGGINEAETLAIMLHNLIDCIPRSARDGRNDRSVGADKPIQQSGFAHVGMPDDRHLGFVSLSLLRLRCFVLGLLRVLRGELVAQRQYL